MQTSSTPPRLSIPLPPPPFPPKPHGGWDVGLHVYDLTNGFMRDHQDVVGSLLGDLRQSVTALNHSGLVVYGLEWYFEGGVAVTAKGATRFGKAFEYIYLGKTDIPLDDFERMWLQPTEAAQFQMAHYHPLRHNCHNFTLAAAQYLLGSVSLLEDGAYPKYLFSNLEAVSASACGRLIAPLMTRYTGGIQRVVLDQLLHHDSERETAARVSLRVASLTCSDVVPPRCVMLFEAQQSVRQPGQIILRLLELGCQEEGCPLFSTDHISIRAVAELLRSGGDASTIMIEEFHVQRLVTVMENLAQALPVSSWELLLDAWRCLALSPQLLIALVCSPVLGSALLRACITFPDFTDLAKIALLRVLCNYAAAPCGAAALCDGRRVHTYVTLIGMALTWPNRAEGDDDGVGSCIVELGACLALNIAVAMVVMVKTSLSRELKHHGEGHAACRLVTILLGVLFVCPPEDRDGTEAVQHVVLLALYHLTSASGDLTAFMTSHPLYHHSKFNALAPAAKTPQCRQLFLMLSVIDEMCVSDSSTAADDSQDGDVEEDIEELVADATTR